MVKEQTNKVVPILNTLLWLVGEGMLLRVFFHMRKKIGRQIMLETKCAQNMYLSTNASIFIAKKYILATEFPTIGGIKYMPAYINKINTTPRSTMNNIKTGESIATAYFKNDLFFILNHSTQ